MKRVLIRSRRFAPTRRSGLAFGRQARLRHQVTPLVCLVAAVLVVPALAADIGSASGAPIRQTATATVRTVLRPVTATGHAAPGYAVLATAASVDCSSASASPATISNNVNYCAPDAAYAIACWKAAAYQRVLCFFDALHKQLHRYRLQSQFAATTAPTPAVPLDIRLRSGVYCQIRDGGTGVPLQGHPNWYASYYCTNRLAIWAPLSSKTAGVNMTHPTWRVHVAPDNGKGRLVVRPVAHAWFVGTRN